MRLLIVDDHEVVRRGVRALLSEQASWDVCGEAIDGLDAIDKARELKPDLIVMDVSMPRLNGLEATRQVRSLLPDCEVLVLSQHENSEMARQALKAGARGYVVKSSISRDLISAVWKASRHEYFFDPAILDQSPTTHTDVHEILQRSAAFEKALRESEDHLQLVTRSMAASVTRCSKDFRYLWVNQGYAAWLRKPAEQIIGQNIRDVIGEEAFEKLLPYFQRVLLGEEVSYEEEVRFQSIGRHWISAAYTPTLDQAGTPDGWVAVVWDITERKHVEEALRESQSQLSLALDSSRTAMFEWDLMARQGKWNPQMATLYEFTPKGEYITVEEWRSLFHPDDTDRLAEEARCFWAGDAVEFTFEFRTVPRNSKLRWILSHGRIVRDAHGKAVRMIGTHSDITERKQFETSLATAARQQKALFHLADELHRAAAIEDVYNAALNAILDALQCNRASILLCDNSGTMRFTSWRGLSREYRAATDGHSAWRPDEKNPQPVCVNDINTADFSDSLKTVIRKEGIGALAFMPLVSNGRLVGKFMAYFNTPHTFTNEEIEAGLTIARQLTFAIERMHGIDALRNSDKATALLAAIVSSSDDAIISKNLDGIITSWNRGAEHIFGYTAKEANGQHITLIIPADRLSEEEDILSRLRRGEKIDHFQTVRQRKDGVLIDVSLTISPLRDSSGRIIGASKVARDITVEKRTAEKIRIADESLRLMRVQDEERRRIARDFHDSAGQTLAVLGMSLAQLVQKAEPISPELASEGREIEELVQQLQREIRTTSYLLHPPLLDEAGLNSALSWYVQGVSERSGVAIEIDVSDNLGRLPSDMEIAIFRIVQECLTNIHRHAESKTAFIRIARDNGSICIEVRDEGKGILPERLAEIESGGSGVGIAGMRERIRYMGGEMSIEASQSGTRVTAIIPTKAGSESQSEEPMQAAV